MLSYVLVGVNERCQSSTQHEAASVKMFHHMLRKNKEVEEEFGRCELSIKEHGDFIAELIMGVPDENSPPVSTYVVALAKLSSQLHLYCMCIGEENREEILVRGMF